jgi:SAM-dependent methyltransferase
MSVRPPVCDYEGSRYSTEFWTHDRRYENMAERVALSKILPPNGQRLIEIGAGAGRLADLYTGYAQVVLMDYARSTLVEAHERWGQDGRFSFVAADVYQLPFVSGAFDTMVMVRVMHHLADVPQALAQLVPALRPGATFVLEYANKRHLKAIARWLVRRQAWSPFDELPYEFAELNFDFHPSWMTGCLREAGLTISRELAVSHFRLPLLKRLLPPRWLAALDGAMQGTGRWWKFSPSVFVQTRAPSTNPSAPASQLFKCPRCNASPLNVAPLALTCPGCAATFSVIDGIYDFKST